MFTPAFAQLMAQYTQWQNNSLYTAAGTIDDEARRLDRGAFFNSIHETLIHILWADHIWLSRFGGCNPPKGKMTDAAVELDDWDKLCAARTDMDQLILTWANALRPDDIAGDLTWYYATEDRELTQPRWILMQQMFNHGTHHRGQVHAMLTAAGAKPEDTDVPFMPSLDA
jgi:uncharacterized damage-inducible protein DinB